MTDEQFDTLIDLLPPRVRFWVLFAVQAVTVLSILLPFFEKLAKSTKTEKDDEAVTVVQRVLSLIPRAKLEIPRVSQRPTKPAPAQAPEKLQVQWPSAEKVAAAQDTPKPPAGS